MAVTRSPRRFAASRIRSIAGRLLDASTLCAIATVSPSGRAHVNTAYFAWGDDFTIVWLSAPQARHSRNLRSNRSAAIAVHDSTQRWGGPDRGIQLFGAAREASGRGARDAARIYAKRFPAYRPTELRAYRFSRFRPTRMKLFHERELGGGVFVTARVSAGSRIEWQRTEIYHS